MEPVSGAPADVQLNTARNYTESNSVAASKPVAASFARLGDGKYSVLPACSDDSAVWKKISLKSWV